MPNSSTIGTMFFMGANTNNINGGMASRLTIVTDGYTIVSSHRHRRPQEETG